VSADPAEWFRRLLSFRRSLTDRKMLICLADSGAIVGGVSLNQIQRGAAQSASAGWWIGDPYEGCGLMADALCTALDHAFRDLRLHRVEANIRPENVRSLRLAERIGFRREGRSPRYLQIAGRWCDHDRFAMLAEEWPGRRRAISDAVRLPTRPGSRSDTAGSRPRC
jgi:ribosomal-protein-alanine N-acetyltransferase